MDQSDDFIFEEWRCLAKSDPEAFESRRRQFLDGFIQSSGRKRTLGKWLQREIDAVRSRAASSEEALRSLAGMMCDQLAFFGEALGALRDPLKRVHERETARLKFRP